MKDSPSPELALRELGGVREDWRGEPKCLVQGEGGSTTSSPSGGTFWREGGKQGPFIPVSQRSPQSPPCPPFLKAAWGWGVAVEQAGRTERDNTVLACSFAHSHIKSNSFIFTFIHPSRAGEGWLGRSGAHWRTSLAGGRRLSGGSPMGQGPMPKGPLSRPQGPGPGVLVSHPCWPGSGGCRDHPCRVWRTRGW